jgi:hypothetical protein
MLKRYVLLLSTFISLAACCRVPRQLEPLIEAPPHPKEIQREKRCLLCLPEDFSVSPFPSLTPEESCSDWGKEYLIGLAFANDFDLYRAITCFKRALVLMSSVSLTRRLEVQYATALAYFLGKKYVEVVYEVESTSLGCVDPSFPAFQDLLLILYESYNQLGRVENAAHLLTIMEEHAHDHACKLNLLSAVRLVDFNALCQISECNPQFAYLQRIVHGYNKEAKSIGKAQALNALLPGAGYWYVGMKETAVTAFLINTLFIAAGAHFITHGNIAAGAITLSLEGGWYFGGIAGAGYAAKHYNEKLYCTFVDKIAQREAFYPILMLNYSF